MLDKLTPSQTNANYSEIPEDIEYYIKESVMAKQPELNLWDFMETRPDLDYERWALKIGSTLTETYEAKPFGRLNINEQDFWSLWRITNTLVRKNTMSAVLIMGAVTANLLVTIL